MKLETHIALLLGYILTEFCVFNPEDYAFYELKYPQPFFCIKTQFADFAT